MTIAWLFATQGSNETSQTIFTGRTTSNVEYVAYDSKHTPNRSEEHTSELQSRLHLVCRLLLEKTKQTKKKKKEKKGIGPRKTGRIL